MRNIYNFNTERQQNNAPIDLAELVALKMSVLIWGRGYYLSTENESLKEKWEEIQKYNFLESIFIEMEKMNSALGYVILVIDLSEDKIPFINIANPWGNYQIEEVNGEIQKLIVWVRYGASSARPFFARITYTQNKIIREIYNSDKTIIGFAEAEKLMSEYNLEKETIHNLGMVPAVFLQNIPKKNFIGGAQATKWYADGVSVAGLQTLLNSIFCILNKEAKFNRTRVFADLNPQNIKEILSGIAGVIGQGDLELNLQELIGDFIIPANLQPVEGGGGNPIAILQGNPQFAQYKELIDYIIDLYFKGCNLSPQKDSEGITTATETQYLNSTEASTIIFKRKFRQQQIKKLIDKMFLLMGASEDDLNYAFEIKDNTSLNTFEDMEKEAQMINLGLSSRIRAYMKLNQVSKEEAEEAIKEIDAENEKFPNPLNEMEAEPEDQELREDK